VEFDPRSLAIGRKGKGQGGYSVGLAGPAFFWIAKQRRGRFCQKTLLGEQQGDRWRGDTGKRIREREA